jgi:hypothetical protein
MPVDFVVLDMQPDSKVSLILGRPFWALPMHTLMSELEKSSLL